MIDIALRQLIAQAAKVDASLVIPGSETLLVTATTRRIVYTLIDDPNRYTDSGVLGVRTAQYQIDIFAPLLSDAKTLLLSIVARANESDPTKRGLDGYRGTTANTNFRRISFGSRHDGRGDLQPGQNKAAARSSVDLNAVYQELRVQPDFAA